MIIGHCASCGKFLTAADARPETPISERLAEIRAEMVDESIARQLQRSIKRNSCMKARLGHLLTLLPFGTYRSILLQIIEDQEPEEGGPWPIV